MKKFGYMLTALTLLLFSNLNPALAAGKKAAPLVGAWVQQECPPDASGKACPLVPKKMQFFKDNTVELSTMPNRSLPYKTELTAEEREQIEARDPEFKGKQLLLIKPNPGMNWLSTPMVYIYSVKRNELTLTIKGWAPSVFKRVAK